MEKYTVWIVGCTGAVGVEMLKCLEELNIPIENLKLWASSRSAGKKIQTYFWEIEIEEVNDNFFVWMDYALFSAGWDNSKKFAPIAIKSGAIVIDNSSVFRYEEDVPLVIPQINADAIWKAEIITNPNCTTAIAAVVLYPIYQKYGYRKWLCLPIKQQVVLEQKEWLNWKRIQKDIFLGKIQK